MSDKISKVKKLDKDKKSSPDKLTSIKSSPMLTLKNAFTSNPSSPRNESASPRNEKGDSKPSSPSNSQPSSPSGSQSSRDPVQKSKSSKGLRDSPSKPRILKSRSSGNVNSGDRIRASPSRPSMGAPDKVNAVIKNLTIRVKEESPTSPRPTMDQIFNIEPLESNEDKIYNLESEKRYNTLFVKEIEQFKENPDIYSTVVFKGKVREEEEEDEDEGNQYSTVVLKGVENSDDDDGNQYGTVVMKGAHSEEDDGPKYGTTVIKSRAPKTLKFLDPAFAKTTIDLAEEKEQGGGVEKVDDKNAEVLAEAHATIISLIEEHQSKFQDLLEKVCMLTDLDVLFVLTNSLKLIRTEIMKMKRHVTICNYSMNFTAQRDDDRLQHAIDYVEDQICGISTLLDSIQHKLPKVKSLVGALFIIETFVNVRTQIDELTTLELDV